MFVSMFEVGEITYRGGLSMPACCPCLVVLTSVLNIFVHHLVHVNTSFSEPGVCMCRGDPHCYQFDAVNHDPNDELYVTKCCWYILTSHGLCGENKYIPFIVAANFDRVKETGAERTYVEQIVIQYIYVRW